MAACQAPAQDMKPPASRHMLYVAPEALPTNYSWQVLGNGATDIVWVGAQIVNNGNLRGAGTAIAAMEIHSNTSARHYLLIGLAGTESGVQILTKPEKRQRSQAALLQLLQQNPTLAGLQLDFEYLQAGHAAAYIEYVRTLRAQLPPGKTLHVAVFPPLGMPAAWTAFHPLTELAAVSDGLIVMLYDHHRAGTVPGCVSGISWLRENAEQLSVLPHEKIWLGAPLYGYRFTGKEARALSRRQFAQFRAESSEADGCLRKNISAQSEAFYPSPQLYAEYATLARQHGFAGIAYWRAGLE